MVNFYSVGMTGNQYGCGINVHQQLKNRYGVGYEDFGTRPYIQSCPISYIPRAAEPPVPKNAFIRFLKQCFCSL